MELYEYKDSKIAEEQAELNSPSLGEGPLGEGEESQYAYTEDQRRRKADFRAAWAEYRRVRAQEDRRQRRPYDVVGGTGHGSRKRRSVTFAKPSSPSIGNQ